MKNQLLILIMACTLTAIMLPSCAPQSEISPTLETRDQVYRTVLHDIRLGDGVPLDIELSVRWKIKDFVSFNTQFAAPSVFDSLVLEPREEEIAAKVANTYPSVDSIFGSWRQRFISDMKETLKTELGEKDITIKEVIITELRFPDNYTQAMEEIGIRAQEIERIRKKSEVDLENSIAAKKQAESDGEVAITRARMDGEIQKIQAKTEEIRRKTTLAKAETDRQVAEKKAQAEARKLELLAQADLKKQTDLKNLEVQNQRNLQAVEIEKMKSLDKVEFERELELARLCTENPVYASFLVNKELASKVQIAVLPSNADNNLFGDLMKTSMSQPNNK